MSAVRIRYQTIAMVKEVRIASERGTAHCLVVKVYPGKLFKPGDFVRVKIEKLKPERKP